MLIRVRKSKDFPDSRIFVAKTFRIKSVNRVNFQIRDKSTYKVCLLDFKHKNGPYSNMLHGVHLKGKQCELMHFIGFFKFIYDSLSDVPESRV